jgi:KilA-N domain
MNNNSVLTHSFGNSIIQQRESDGYINATAMCKATGKLWAHYMENGSTKEFLQELSLTIGIPIVKNSNYGKIPALELIQSETGRYGGTWVHPYIAINLAQWCSAAFAVQVSKWVIDWFKGAQNPITQQPQSDHIQELQLKLQILQIELEIANKHGSAALELSLIPLGAKLKQLTKTTLQPPITTKPKPPRAKPDVIKNAWREILAVRETWTIEGSCYGWLTPDNEAFAYCYNDRQLDLPDWVYKAVPTTRFATVSRMMAQQQVDVRLAQIQAEKQFKRNS